MAKKLSPAEQAIISASDAGYYATTIRLAQQFLKQQPDNFRILLELGNACWQLGRFQDSEQALERALGVCQHEQQDVVYGELGNMFRMRGDFSQAATYYQKQIEHTPGDATGYLFLGLLNLRQGKLEDATNILELGTKCDVGVNEELFLALGLAYLAREDYPSAIGSLQKANAINPKHNGIITALKDAQKCS